MSQPECDLACQTKIIINGGTAARLLAAKGYATASAIIESTCEGLQHFFRSGGRLKTSGKIIHLLNEIEDAAISAVGDDDGSINKMAIEIQKAVVKEGVGYSGPTGKMLQ